MDLNVLVVVDVEVSVDVEVLVDVDVLVEVDVDVLVLVDVDVLVSVDVDTSVDVSLVEVTSFLSSFFLPHDASAPIDNAPTKRLNNIFFFLTIYSSYKIHYYFIIIKYIITI